MLISSFFSLEATGEFVVCIMSDWFVEAANHCCGSFARGNPDPLWGYDGVTLHNPTRTLDDTVVISQRSLLEAGGGVWSRSIGTPNFKVNAPPCPLLQVPTSLINLGSLASRRSG